MRTKLKEYYDDSSFGNFEAFEIEQEYINDENIYKIPIVVFNKKYPGVELIRFEDGVKTGDNFGLKNSQDFIMQYKIRVDSKADTVFVGPMITSAAAGKYKGVVSDIIKSLFAYIKRKTPTARHAIFIENDMSDGAWQAIANKLNVKILKLNIK